MAVKKIGKVLSSGGRLPLLKMYIYSYIYICIQIFAFCLLAMQPAQESNMKRDEEWMREQPST